MVRPLRPRSLQAQEAHDYKPVTNSLLFFLSVILTDSSELEPDHWEVFGRYHNAVFVNSLQFECYPTEADVGGLPSGSRSRGTPSLFCAMLKASSRFSRADLSSACFMSTKVQSIAFMIAKKARPLLQLLAKS